jgi:hypothetical protein
MEQRNNDPRCGQEDEDVLQPRPVIDHAGDAKPTA